MAVCLRDAQKMLTFLFRFQTFSVAMQDGNHLIARIADSHMPTSIMESEVRRVLPSL
jgi:hypothetical protein